MPSAAHPIHPTSALENPITTDKDYHFRRSLPHSDDLDANQLHDLLQTTALNFVATIRCYVHHQATAAQLCDLHLYPRAPPQHNADHTRKTVQDDPTNMVLFHVERYHTVHLHQPPAANSSVNVDNDTAAVEYGQDDGVYVPPQGQPTRVPSEAAKAQLLCEHLRMLRACTANRSAHASSVKPPWGHSV